MTKRIFSALLVALLLGGASLSYAAPERMLIKHADKKIKERSAANSLKSVDIRDIEDPAARKAIKEIVNYLGLKTKK